MVRAVIQYIVAASASRAGIPPAGIPPTRVHARKGRPPDSLASSRYVGFGCVQQYYTLVIGASAPRSGVSQ